MSKNIYVGNLSFQTTADDLRSCFGEHGTVTRAQVATDRETGRSRGFGFVEMSERRRRGHRRPQRHPARGPHPDRQRGQAPRGPPALGGGGSATAAAIGGARRDRY